jgi:hypothetical protein
MLPGALVLTAAIVFYGLGVLDLVQISAVFAAHLIIDLVYALTAPFFTARIAPALSGNPFSPPPETQSVDKPPPAAT